MRSEFEREMVADLAKCDINASVIARVTRIPRSTIRGCLNRVNGKGYPRYFFSQVSDDIRRLFCETCEKIGVEYRLNRWDSVSIARAPSVAILDSFVGPKA